MMRLTLRTLLAYLDDVLSPDDTKNIGEKIQESPMAQLLVSRIREVMRRRRLAAPDVFGPEMGIDPNIISQYLDNTLSADRYADVERVLLASDEMLAEAAACHQILTVVLADPTEVPATSRERLYALGPVDLSSQLSGAGETSNASISRTPRSIATRNGSTVTAGKSTAKSKDLDASMTTVPDYLKPAPWSTRVLPTAIVAVLILACAFLLAPDFVSGLRQVNHEMKRKETRNKDFTSDTTEDEVRIADGNSRANEIDGPPIGPDRTTQRLADNRGSGSLPVGIDPLPPQDDSDDSPVPAPMPATKTEPAEHPADARLAVEPSPKVPRSERPQNGDPVPRPPEKVADVPIGYTSNEGVLNRYNDAQQHWLMVPRRSAINSGETIANIEPFESNLDIDSGNIKLTLIGETVVKILNPGEAGNAGMEIKKGRLIIQNNRSGNEQPVRIGIAIGDDLWHLDLMTSDTVCGFNITSRKATQFQKLQDYHWYQATLYVISGTAIWTNQAKQAQEISDHLELNIIPEKDALVRSSPISFPSIPDWCDSGKRKIASVRKQQYNVQFEKAFELNLPVEESMLVLVKSSKRPRIAELAAAGLATIDNYAGLVETLAECPHEEARFAARDGLRQWLPLHPDRGPKLMAELESHYPPADADAIYQMLWGFTRDDVTNTTATPVRLLSWMRSSRIEIRELADFWVRGLIGRKTDFNASASPGLRESHVRRLEDLIQKHNGLIKGP